MGRLQARQWIGPDFIGGVPGRQGDEPVVTDVGRRRGDVHPAAC